MLDERKYQKLKMKPTQNHFFKIELVDEREYQKV